MKLLNGKYRMKPIQIEGNRDRLMDSMDASIKKVHPGKLGDLPRNLINLRHKARKLIDYLSEQGLMYANEVVLNFEGKIVIMWFKHNGTANISLVISNEGYEVFYKLNNTTKLLDKTLSRPSTAIDFIDEVLNSFPNVPKAELV